jgi:dTDP-4-dehydrorhamnose 3,5-epimerase
MNLPDIRGFAIPGLLAITPRKFSDSRGFFCETFNADAFAKAGIACDFVQDNMAFSAHKGTVRGLHFQAPPHTQAKLVRVLRGSTMEVVVDLRRTSPTYGRHETVTLNAADGVQLFVPEGLAHGYCTLEPDIEVAYKTSRPYVREADTGIRWNDPALGIAWPDFAGAQLSDRDNRLPLLAQNPTPFD